VVRQRKEASTSHPEPAAQPSGPRPLSHRGMPALWVTEAQSTIGDQLARIAVMVLVYQQTSSAVWVAATLALTYLPDLAGSLGLSWLADRYSRRGIMVIGSLVQASCFAAMAVPGQPPWGVAVLVALAAIALAPYRAASMAQLPDLVPASDLKAVQDLMTWTRTVVQIGGFAIGGGVVVLVGTSAALLINAATFVIAAAIIRGGVPDTRSPQREPTEKQHGIIRPALAVLRSDRRLWSILMLLSLAGVTIVPDAVSAPLVVELDAPTWTLGWILAAHPVGTAIGIPLRRRFFSDDRAVDRLVWISLAPLVVFVLLAAVPSVWVAVALLVVSGVGMAYHPALSVEYLQHAPIEYRGTLMGIGRAVLRVSQGIGAALGGLVSQAVGSSLGSVALIALLGVMVAARGLAVRRAAAAESGNLP